MFQGKKITLATVKSFVKKNLDNLYIRNDSDFDGMQDCVVSSNNSSFKATKADEREHCFKNTLGISGAWFVGSSRDYFDSFDNGEYAGVEVYNSCGSFVLAVKK